MTRHGTRKIKTSSRCVQKWNLQQGVPDKNLEKEKKGKRGSCLPISRCPVRAVMCMRERSLDRLCSSWQQLARMATTRRCILELIYSVLVKAYGLWNTLLVIIATMAHVQATDRNGRLVQRQRPRPSIQTGEWANWKSAPLCRQW